MFLVMFKGEAGWDVHGSKVFVDYWALSDFFLTLYKKEAVPRLRKHMEIHSKCNEPHNLSINSANFEKWLKQRGYNTWIPFEITESGLVQMEWSELRLWAERSGKI